MDLKNKTIGIWGYGRVGQAAAQFLLEQNARVIVYDDKPVQIADTSITIAPTLEAFFDQACYLLPIPGVDVRPYRSMYQGNWLSELDLFQYFFHKPIIATTGSVGKTTVTYLLTHALKQAGWHVEAAGNIGTPALSMINQQKNLDAIILEVSSFQLEYAQAFAPDLALWTNFYPNHLDRHATMEDYFAAKYNIIQNQKSDQTALLPRTLAPDIYALSPKSTLCFFDTKEKPDQAGHGFAVNWLIVEKALSLLGVAQQPLSAIQPIEHRLEHIAVIKGVVFYNDSKSTIPASTLAAVKNVTAKRIMLFLGGLSKGIDRTPLIAQLANKSIHVFCFGKEAEQLHAICAVNSIPSSSSANLDDAFALCVQTAGSGDCVLFSPAGSSFDLFENYEKRGEKFKQLVNTYRATISIP